MKKLKNLKILLVAAGLIGSLFFVNCNAMEKKVVDTNDVVEEKSEKTLATTVVSDEGLREMGVYELKRHLKLQEQANSLFSSKLTELQGLKERYQRQNLTLEEEIRNLNEQLDLLDRHYKKAKEIKRSLEKCYGKIDNETKFKRRLLKAPNIRRYLDEVFNFERSHIRRWVRLNNDDMNNLNSDFEDDYEDNNYDENWEEGNE